MKAEMTALEMARKYGWAEVTVHLGVGHFTVAGRTRVIETGGQGNAVWVDKLALDFGTAVAVDPMGEESAVVSVFCQNQKNLIRDS